MLGSFEIESAVNHLFRYQSGKMLADAIPDKKKLESFYLYYSFSGEIHAQRFGGLRSAGISIKKAKINRIFTKKFSTI